MKKALVILFIFVLITAAFPSQQDNSVAKRIAAVDTSMWTYLSATDTSLWSISKADSEQTFKRYFVDGYKIFRRIKRLQQRIDNGRLKYEQAAPDLENLLNKAREKFEAGLKENPFDKYYKQALTGVYFDLIQLYTFKKEDDNRLEVFLNLLQYEKNRKNRIALLNQAGSIYFKYEMWNLAKEKFRVAVNTIFEGDMAEIDSLVLFRNIYFRGQTYMKLYDADSALLSLKRARMISPTERETNQITDLINFINWDEGNIRATELYYDARLLVSQKEYEKGEQAYLNLLEKIQSQRARWEAQLKLAIIQYDALGKPEQALDRLWNVVRHFENDSLPNVDGFVAEEVYWENYGYMCFQQANNYLNENRKRSFIYYYKASRVEGPDRGRAFLGMAGICVNNPEICLDYCQNAYQFQHQLTDPEKKNLFNLFYLSYKKKGEFKESIKWYERFRQI